MKRRRNGLVKVPDEWFQIALAGFLSSAPKVYLPLSVWPYPTLLPSLKERYPKGRVSLYLFGLDPTSSTKGAMSSTDKHRLAMAPAEQGRFESTLRHELRHLMQNLGDEALKGTSKKAKHSGFGRPSKQATRALRKGKIALKAIEGKSPKTYFHSASEWQPWVGSTADEIIGRAKAKGKEPGPKLNAYIRKKVLSSDFYNLTAPSTRKELLRQVYAEVMRRW